MTEKEKFLKNIFNYIGKNGWENFSLENFSEDNKVKIKKINKYFDSNDQLITCFVSTINDKTFNEISNDSVDMTSVKDTLFEFIMIRFDKLTPYKDGLREIFTHSKKNPFLINLISKKVFKFIEFIFDLSGAKKNFVLDKISKNILFIIYLYVFNVWLGDETSEMSKTMSELNTCLTKAEDLVKKINLF